MKKQILTAALLSLLSAGLTAAELTVAATPVPHGDILRLVAPDLKAQGYDLKVVEFSDIRYAHFCKQLFCLFTNSF